MKMKIVTLGSALLLIGFFSHAQKGQLRVGLNLANVSVTDNGRVDEANLFSDRRINRH